MQGHLDDRAALDWAVLSASVFPQQVRVPAPIPPLVLPRTQTFGTHQQGAPSSEVPLWVHPVVQREAHSVDYGPVDLGAALYWRGVHEAVDLWEIHLLPRLHLPMHPEEPCYRKVSAHLSK